ncbi:hypothetical protein [Streptomyces sp. NBC_00441]|uniref:hypothetical protein n=1 Tax=Streptomyces sp. NBC_00441 TaxID=2975742 RepID=UPI003FCD2FB9
MTIALSTPDTEGLAAAADAPRDWQAEGAPMQLHPGWGDGAGAPTSRGRRCAAT